MSYEPTNWKDRVVEKPRTFTMQQNPDGTITLVPAPGTVVQEGTPVNAANLNKLENGLVSHLAEYVKQKPKKILKGLKDINAYVIPGWSYTKLVQAGYAMENTTYYYPIYISEKTNFSAVAMGIIGTFGETMEIRIYDSNSDLMPTNQIINVGIMDVSTPGTKEILIEFELDVGYYFLANRSSGGNPQVVVPDTMSSPISSLADIANMKCFNSYLVAGNMTNPATTPTNLWAGKPGIFLKLKD